MLYRLFYDHIVCRIDAEKAHDQAVRLIATAGHSPAYRILKGSLGYRGVNPIRTVLPRPVPGLVGLAAGMDKNAEAILGMDALGFGFVEIGTVTPLPQPGNDKPRMWRHEGRALRNAMGFNNEGADSAAAKLATLRSTARGRSVIVGVNIGKNKWTPEEEAARDYRTCASRLARYADYLVVNVSSPNTPGLRNLLAIEALTEIVEATTQAARRAAGRDVPVLVKISPDMADEDIDNVADLVRGGAAAGIVATNTTIDHRFGSGGLSGAPLRDRSLQVVRRLRTRLGVEPIIIGVGGISTIDDANAMIAAGADLLQIYSSFVYEGPALPGKLNRLLAAQHS